MKRNAVLTSTFANEFDTAGMLSGKSPSGAHRKPLMRLACGVAIALVGGLSFGAGPADGGSIDAIEPKAYIRANYSQKQALCLIKLYGKESAFKTSAVGNLNGSKQTFGIPQLKNPIIKDLSANKQIDYGMKYINHRYEGKPCLAWNHWIKKGWH
jgi:hypothetical protein